MVLSGRTGFNELTGFIEPMMFNELSGMIEFNILTGGVFIELIGFNVLTLGWFMVFNELYGFIDFNILTGFNDFNIPT
jgi:hypothetical protein